MVQRGAYPKLGPHGIDAVFSWYSAAQKPALTLDHGPMPSISRPSIWPYVSLSSVFAGLAPKIQSSDVPAKFDGLPLGNATSVGDEMPCMVYEAPVLNTSPSNTSCFGVLPTPRVYPRSPVKVRRSVARY